MLDTYDRENIRKIANEEIEKKLEIIISQIKDLAERVENLEQAYYTLQYDIKGLEIRVENIACKI